MTKPILIIIDANSLIHRAWHALPPLKTRKGVLVNAIYGFFSIFLKAVKDFDPAFVVAAFDFPSPTFRHRLSPAYKAQRPPLPEELLAQLPTIKEILGLFGIPVFEQKGFEADDIIGTLVKLIESDQAVGRPEIVILSSDRDLLQLVSAGVKVLILEKGVSQARLYDEKLVEEKFAGLKPKQLVDFKALRGDPSDNIAGAQGIGEKTALKLIQNFGDLETLYAAIDKNGLENLTVSVKNRLRQSCQQVFLSRDLARINQDIPLIFSLADCRWGKYDREQISNRFQELQFFSLLKRLP